MPQIQSDAGVLAIEGHPNECPFCHKMITPTYFHSHKNGNSLEVIMICPNQTCRKSFICYYNVQGSYFLFSGNTTVGKLVGKEFSETITSISEGFASIYNQAFSAEQYSLTEICGVGYRKALEFLIKDYAIATNPNIRELIEKKMLGACISEYVDDNRIKSVAKRAVWLGNDETHYIRKWEGKNLEDLKKLIDLTIHWIEMEALTKSFEDEMPD